MRTDKEIKKEIQALRKFVPIGPFKNSTCQLIKLAIEELEYGVDQSSGEYFELESSQKECVLTTNDWKEGLIKHPPSKWWGKLVK